MQYVYQATKYMEKSINTEYKNKHGAVCVIGGKVVSGGWNYPDNPHQVKVEERDREL